MKTHTIKTPTAELLIVELPRVCDYELDDEMLWVINLENGFTYRAEGSYTLLGKPDEISEEDIKELVEWGDADPSGDRFIIGYRSYFDGYSDDVPLFTCKTPTESLFSLLESEIFWNVNPLGKEKPNFDPFLIYGQNEYWVDLKNNWYEAEQKTFDRNRTLIFKKH